MYIAPLRPKTQRRLEDRELNQARSKPDTVDQLVRTARTFVHHYNSTQYCNTETVSLIFPFLQTNITSQMWPSGGKGRGGVRIGHRNLLDACISSTTCHRCSRNCIGCECPSVSPSGWQFLLTAVSTTRHRVTSPPSSNRRATLVTGSVCARRRRPSSMFLAPNT